MKTYFLLFFTVSLLFTPIFSQAQFNRENVAQKKDSATKVIGKNQRIQVFFHNEFIYVTPRAYSTRAIFNQYGIGAIKHFKHFQICLNTTKWSGNKKSDNLLNSIFNSGAEVQELEPYKIDTQNNYIPFH